MSLEQKVNSVLFVLTDSTRIHYISFTCLHVSGLHIYWCLAWQVYNMVSLFIDIRLTFLQMCGVFVCSCLAQQIYSIWFMHLPSYLHASRHKIKGLRHAFDTLVRMQAEQPHTSDEVINLILIMSTFTNQFENQQKY